jgi:hypothetical protein
VEGKTWGTPMLEYPHYARSPAVFMTSPLRGISILIKECHNMPVDFWEIAMVIYNAHVSGTLKFLFAKK